MELSPIVSLLWLTIYLLHLSSATDPKTYEAQQRNSSQGVSQELFDSLDELARIVDISYCIGSTGIYKPFECLSRCAEFENFELVTVRIILSLSSSLSPTSPHLHMQVADNMLLDVGHRPSTV